jgi:hypothetical protein
VEDVLTGHGTSIEWTGQLFARGDEDTTDEHFKHTQPFPSLFGSYL